MLALGVDQRFEDLRQFPVPFWQIEPVGTECRDAEFEIFEPFYGRKVATRFLPISR
ncbi:MAG: hypothetical protein IPK52_15975 [Chloroflexi bacterium]|nr:hypothetical protein [Chloroflexota bacterium]